MQGRRRWQPLVLLGLALLLVSSVISCGEPYTQEDLDAADEEAYARGYKLGHTLGELLGFSKGRVVGHAEWKEANEHQTKLAYDRGYQLGYQEAQGEGYDRGYSDGYEKGHSEGYSKGCQTCTRPPPPQPSTPDNYIEPQPSPPDGQVTAICNDGWLSYSKHRSGTCSHHGGVKEWVNRPPN